VSLLCRLLRLKFNHSALKEPPNLLRGVMNKNFCGRQVEHSRAGNLSGSGAGAADNDGIYLARKSAISPQNTGADQSYLFSVKGVKRPICGRKLSRSPINRGRNKSALRPP
jgi:hypothetical protein